MRRLPGSYEVMSARLAPSYGPAPAGQYSSNTVQQDVSRTTGATTAAGDSHHYCRCSVKRSETVEPNAGARSVQAIV